MRENFDRQSYKCEVLTTYDSFYFMVKSSFFVVAMLQVLVMVLTHYENSFVRYNDVANTEYIIP